MSITTILGTSRYKHIFREGHTQYLQKINIRARILENVFSHKFMEDNLTTQLFMDLLGNMIIQHITESLQNQVDQNGNCC